MSDPLIALRTLARAQHGVVERAQALNLGIDRRRIDRRVAAGECDWLTREVLIFTAVPTTADTHAMAAVLSAGPGAALCDEAALAHWGLPGFEIDPTGVVLPRRTRRQVLGPVRVCSVLPRDHWRVIRGVKVTSVERTLVDVSSRLPSKRLERVLDTAWVKGLVSRAILVAVADQLAGKGRRSQDKLRRLLAERGPDWVPPASGYEALFHELIADSGQPEFQRRVLLGDEDGIIGEVDCYDPESALVVEVDSVRFHASPTDAAHDAWRDSRLAAVGIHVERVSENDLHRSPRVVVARIGRLRRSRRSSRAA